MGLSKIVAGGRIERPSQGYEPCEMPLLYPAVYLEYYSKIVVFARDNLKKVLNMVFCNNVGVAQSVERRTHKPQVTGSIPVADTNFTIKNNFEIIRFYV